MAVKTQKPFYVERSYKTKHCYCPECRTLMAITDQSKENNVLFTWYECGQTDCDGQWLCKEVLGGS